MITEAQKEARRKNIERLISEKDKRNLSKDQVAAIKRCEKTATRSAFLIPIILEIYLTNDEKRKEWFNYNRKQKTAHLLEHLRGLNGRRLGDIAKEFFALNTPECGKTITVNILNIAVEEGSLSEEERNKERKYRYSIAGKRSAGITSDSKRNIFFWDEEKRERYRRYIIKNIIGSDAYSAEEDELLLRLVNDIEYIRSAKSYRPGYPNWPKIAEDVSKIRKKRSANAVRNRYSLLKKQQTNKQA